MVAWVAMDQAIHTHQDTSPAGLISEAINPCAVGLRPDDPHTCTVAPKLQVHFVVEDGRVLIEKEPAEGSPGSEGLKRLRRARLRTRLSTDELLALTRGEEQP